MIKRPLIPVALLYVGGILLAALPVPLFPLLVGSILLGLLCLFWNTARRVLLVPLLVMAGWVNLAERTAVLSPHDLRAEFPRPEEIVTVRGVLGETPYHRVHEIKGMDFWSSMARLQVTAVRPKDAEWQPAAGEVITSTKEFPPDTFFAGQTVEIAGVLRRTRGPVAEGLFDYREFLRHQEIYYQLEVKKVDDWQIVSAPAYPPLADRFCAWARQSLALGLPVEDESLRLEWALTLGWKAALNDQVADVFVKAATYHIFAVDGLRIAIIAGILLGALRLFGLPRAWCGLVAAPVILFYATMTGWPASAIRAIVMIAVVFGGWALARPSDLINSLFAAALIILVWQPSQLFQAGFQLSFLVVLCIILILPFFDRIGENLLRPDPLRPESLEPRWQKILRWITRKVTDLFLTSLAAWLGSIPLVALYFHLLTPLSGPANVLAVPLCALVLICNLASLMLVGWLPWIAILFNHAGWFFMGCIRTTSTWSAHWPGAYFYVPVPGLFTIGLYYLILMTLLTGWLFQGRRIWKISGISFLIIVWCGLWFAERPTTNLTILPLSGGHSIYVRPNAGWNDWLIDCGNEQSADAVLKPFLQAQGVNHLANLLLTHGEINYTGGAETIFDEFHPRNLYASPIHFRSPEYREFTADKQASFQPRLEPGARISPWTVLYPPPETTLTKADDNALVLRGEINGTRILLLSDLSHAGQNSLLNSSHADLRADIVVAALPGEGEGEPLSDALLNVIQPQAIVIADSTLPAEKRAGEKLKQRLARTQIPTFYTSVSDAVTISIHPHHWQLSAMDGNKVSGTNHITIP